MTIRNKDETWLDKVEVYISGLLEDSICIFILLAWVFMHLAFIYIGCTNFIKLINIYGFGIGILITMGIILLFSPVILFILSIDISILNSKSPKKKNIMGRWIYDK